MVLMRGNLKKKSTGMLGGWQSRYFALHEDGRLLYYANEIDFQTNYIPKGKIILEHRLAEVVLTGGSSFFINIVGRRKYEFQAENDGESKVWFDAINNFLNVTDITSGELNQNSVDVNSLSNNLKNESTEVSSCISKNNNPFGDDDFEVQTTICSNVVNVHEFKSETKSIEHVIVPTTNSPDGSTPSNDICDKNPFDEDEDEDEMERVGEISIEARIAKPFFDSDESNSIEVSAATVCAFEANHIVVQSMYDDKNGNPYYIWGHEAQGNMCDVTLPDYLPRSDDEEIQVVSPTEYVSFYESAITTTASIDSGQGEGAGGLHKSDEEIYELKDSSGPDQDQDQEELIISLPNDSSIVFKAQEGDSTAVKSDFIPVGSALDLVLSDDSRTIDVVAPLKPPKPSARTKPPLPPKPSPNIKFFPLSPDSNLIQIFLSSPPTDSSVTRPRTRQEPPLTTPKNLSSREEYVESNIPTDIPVPAPAASPTFLEALVSAPLPIPPTNAHDPQSCRVNPPELISDQLQAEVAALRVVSDQQEVSVPESVTSASTAGKADSSLTNPFGEDEEEPIGSGTGANPFADDDDNNGNPFDDDCPAAVDNRNPFDDGNADRASDCKSRLRSKPGGVLGDPGGCLSPRVSATPKAASQAAMTGRRVQAPSAAQQGRPSHTREGSFLAKSFENVFDKKVITISAAQDAHWNSQVRAKVGSWLPNVTHPVTGIKRTAYVIHIMYSPVQRSWTSFHSYDEFQKLQSCVNKYVRKLSSTQIRPFPTDMLKTWSGGESDEVKNERQINLDAWLKSLLFDSDLMNNSAPKSEIYSFLEVQNYIKFV